MAVLFVRLERRRTVCSRAEAKTLHSCLRQAFAVARGVFFILSTPRTRSIRARWAASTPHSTITTMNRADTMYDPACRWPPGHVLSLKKMAKSVRWEHWHWTLEPTTVAVHPSCPQVAVSGCQKRQELASTTGICWSGASQGDGFLFKGSRKEMSLVRLRTSTSVQLLKIEMEVTLLPAGPLPLCCCARHLCSALWVTTEIVAA
mmetsp:Transcript_19665/g.38950  ORF Transcript_19665/g.38950 Transcript_19665/m.38950 type:complete len:204 (+) Transcript_19665:1017-1628(+)